MDSTTPVGWMTPFYILKMMQMKKTGENSSKTGVNGFFFQKTESESWGLPLMNGGLKSRSIYTTTIMRQEFCKW